MSICNLATFSKERNWMNEGRIDYLAPDHYLGLWQTFGTKRWMRTSILEGEDKAILLPSLENILDFDSTGQKQNLESTGICPCAIIQKST